MKIHLYIITDNRISLKFTFMTLFNHKINMAIRNQLSHFTLWEFVVDAHNVITTDSIIIKKY